MDKRCIPLHPLFSLSTSTLRTISNLPCLTSNTAYSSDFIIMDKAFFFLFFFVTFEVSILHLCNPAFWTKPGGKSYFEAPTHSFLYPMSSLSRYKNKGNLKMEGQFPEGKQAAERN